MLQALDNLLHVLAALEVGHQDCVLLDNDADVGHPYRHDHHAVAGASETVLRILEEAEAYVAFA